MKQILNNLGDNIVDGIKYTIPLIVLFSVFSAIVDAGYIRIQINLTEYIFLLLVPILMAFITHSIIPKILFVPAFILGYFVGLWGLGYIGGIIGGLVYGYLVKYIVHKITILDEKKKMMFQYVVVSLVVGVIVYLFMFFAMKPLILFFLDTIRDVVDNIPIGSTVIIVIVLSLLTVIDLGGPLNKLGYSFIIQFYADGFYHVVGPVLVSVMLPPLAVFLSLLFLKNRFNSKDQSSIYIALIGGMFGLTEGALLVGYRRPLKIIPILVIGSVIASAFASFLGLVNHSLLVGLPSLLTINKIGVYLLSVAIGLTIILSLFVFTLPKEKNSIEK